MPLPSISFQPLAKADIFSLTAQTRALPVCETSARVGTLTAPFLGTLPTNVAGKDLGLLRVGLKVIGIGCLRVLCCAVFYFFGGGEECVVYNNFSKHIQDSVSWIGLLIVDWMAAFNFTFFLGTQFATFFSSCIIHNNCASIIYLAVG